MTTQTRSSAVKFIVALGLISMMADVTYEGARSITGPYLGSLGASAAAIGLVVGFGEFAGFALRFFSGRAADKTKSYWALMIFGYIVNLGAVPLLALAGRWEVAAMLIVLERVGKAIRVPSRDVMLSQAANLTGRGWGFGVHEAMDQFGAFMGPLLVAAVLAATGRMQSAFAVLAIPAALGVVTMLTARWIYPDPERFETKSPSELSTSGLPRSFWMLVVAAGFLAAGTCDFALIALHLTRAAITTEPQTPILYAAANGVQALAALTFGRMFDRVGISVVVLGALLGAGANLLVFGNSFWFAVAGMILWGAGLGAQNSALKASVANVVPTERRGSAFGIYQMFYGIFWFGGSAAMGFIFERSMVALAILGAVLQVAAIPFLLASRRQRGA